jgi:hypothetical protein
MWLWHPIRKSQSHNIRTVDHERTDDGSVMQELRADFYRVPQRNGGEEC